jgi:hypothetical protein
MSALGKADMPRNVYLSARPLIRVSATAASCRILSVTIGALGVARDTASSQTSLNMPKINIGMATMIAPTTMRGTMIWFFIFDYRADWPRLSIKRKGAPDVGASGDTDDG